MYDLQEDPHELHNLYGRAEYGSITAALKKQMAALQKQYGDTEALAKNEPAAG